MWQFVSKQRLSYCAIILNVLMQGMCLSGGEQEDANQQMIEHIFKHYPNISNSIVIKTDTFGSIATACEKGVLT